MSELIIFKSEKIDLLVRHVETLCLLKTFLNSLVFINFEKIDKPALDCKFLSVNCM